MNELNYQLDLVKAMNQKLLAKERMYQLVCDTVSCAFVYYTFDKNELTTLGKWDEFFDFRINDVKEIPKLFDVVEDSYALPLLDVIFPEKNNKNFASVDCYMKEKNVWYRFTTQVICTEEGQPSEKVICIENITKTKSQNDELSYMAYYDSRTGLYNRNYFVRLLDDYLEKAKRDNNVVSLLVIDIDDFQRINEGQGIIVGDEMIQVFGSFLKEFANDKVMACRLNGDVFGIAVYEPSGENSVDSIVRKIQDRMKKPFFLTNDREMRISASMSIVEYPEAASNAIELLNCGQIILFEGKSKGNSVVQYYSEKLMDKFLDAVEMDKKLREAVFQHNFEIYFQPQYYTDSRKIRGVEALIRWKDNVGNGISPSIFIPVAEQNGTIIPIGDWVLEQSIMQYMKWKEEFGIEFVLSINISALQYMREDFTDSLLSILSRYGMKPTDLELEITETVLIENFETISEKLRQLKEYGIKISLDDFGTGYSSLSYLMRLPIDTLKIDRTFIEGMTTDKVTRVIVDSILGMAKALGFESVAEGVEREDQFHYLSEAGCDIIQGYLFARPQPALQLEQLLQHMD